MDSNFFKMHIANFQGAAIAAGRAVGKWDETKHIPIEETKFSPKISEGQRDNRYSHWKKAIERSLGWDI